MEWRIECPCAVSFDVPARWQGRQVDCPGCGRRHTVTPSVAVPVPGVGPRGGVDPFRARPQRTLTAPPRPAPTAEAVPAGCALAEPPEAVAAARLRQRRRRVRVVVAVALLVVMVVGTLVVRAAFREYRRRMYRGLEPQRPPATAPVHPGARPPRGTPAGSLR